jgi:hypothetical protein
MLMAQSPATDKITDGACIACIRSVVRVESHDLFAADRPIGYLSADLDESDQDASRWMSVNCQDLSSSAGVGP